MNTFAEQCTAAYTVAVTEAHPFTPSRAQIEAALDPLMRGLNPDYIRATYNRTGIQPIALEMFKRACK